MGLIFRTIFTASTDEYFANVDAICSKWLILEGLDVELPARGAVECDGQEVTVARADDPALRSHRFVFAEERESGGWCTALTAVAQSDVTTAWVDVEFTARNPLGERPRINPPDILRELVASIPCSIGGTNLSLMPHVYPTGEGAEVVGATIQSATRELPLVVVTQDRWGSADDAESRGSGLLDRLLGWAEVHVLDREAGLGLRSIIGEERGVLPGAARLYLPSKGRPPDPRRDVIVPSAILAKQPGSSAVRFQKVLAPPALAQRPPDVYFEHVIRLPGFPRHVSDSGNEHWLLDALLTTEEERDTLRAEVGFRNEAVVDVYADQEELLASLNAVESRVRYLERKLHAAGEHDIHESPEAVEEDVESCVSAIELARQTLSLVEIGDTRHEAGELDQHLQSSLWGRKALKAFRSMQSYAELQEAGVVDGSFMDYLQSPQPGVKIPTSWVAMKEDETTDNSPACRAARVFAVPPEVNRNEEVYMECHVKIERGGRPAPRIHFHDDTKGHSGKIWVGYFGKHLPSTND